MSFSLLLLCAAGLFAQTLRNLSRVDAGMDREHVLTVHLDMRNTGFAEHQNNLPSFYDTLIQHLKALPMVRDAAVICARFPIAAGTQQCMSLDALRCPETQLHGEEDKVGVGYFRTLAFRFCRAATLAKRTSTITASRDS